MSRNRPTIGIVAALDLERRWIGSAPGSTLIEVGGMGRVRAEAAATRLLGRGVSALVSWGIAGGLDPSLKPGTVVVPEVVLDVQGADHRVDAGWRGRLLVALGDHVPISTGPVLHVDEVIGSPRRKRELHDLSRAAAVDMESAGVARVAEDAGVPWLVLRAVGDSAVHELPTVVAKISDDRGRLRPGAVVGLVLRPRLWPALIALGRANAAAGRSMRRVWSLAGPELAQGACQHP